MKRFIPSKTFIAGEYSVLVGGASLSIATKPYFEFSYSDEKLQSSFHPESPAGLYLKKYNSQTGSIYFFDPYVSRQVKGGFGRSTAEFISACWPNIEKFRPSAKELRQWYLELFLKSEQKPSGVDLVTQYLGGWVVSDVAHEKFKTVTPRLQQTSMALISTGLKLPTHEHLSQLNYKSIESLPRYSSIVIDCYLNKSEDDFLKAIAEWSDVLKNSGLTSEKVVELMSFIKSQIPEIKLLKACGALGADVIAVFYDKNLSSVVTEKLRNLKFPVQMTVDDLAVGVASELD